MNLITNYNLSSDFKITDEIYFNDITNHKELIQNLIKISDKISIVSPFLMEDFESFFSNINIKNKKFELITSCQPRGDEQLTKPFKLLNFGNYISSVSNDWPEIHLINNLHSKIYIFYKNQKRLCAVVTSANFTISGLSKNHETGFLITDNSIIISLEKDIQKSLEYVSLRDFHLKRLCDIANIMKNKKRYEVQKDIDIGLLKNIQKDCIPSSNNRNTQLRDNAKYFIKVSGVKDRPILPQEKRKINVPYSQLDFSKKPMTINLGDCLIEVAVGGQCFLNYYAVASKTFERTEKEKKDNKDYARWPYYVYANNLSLHFGEKWFESPLMYDEISKKFKETYPNYNITPSGNDSIKGAVCIGHSYFQITKEFGEYVKGIIASQ